MAAAERRDAGKGADVDNASLAGSEHSTAALLAAAEAAVGLAIIVIYYKNKGSIQVEQISSLKG